MNNEFKFSNRQQVKFDNGVISGIGVVVGCSDIGSPFIGKTYLIDVDESDQVIPNKEYPFSVIPMFELFINAY